jgi:CDP-paratose 2-epimerase
VVGVDNDTRGRLFGASIKSTYDALVHDESASIIMTPLDVSVEAEVAGLFRQLGPCDLIVHTAGQPSHDYSAEHPIEDFVLNAQATLLLLENMRRSWPDCTFVFCSTNKVYGDFPSTLAYAELPTRWLPTAPRWRDGFNESVPLEGTAHSPFGVSKLYADQLVREYGLYHGLKTAAFRCGCITGAAHKGVPLHGFLAYLVGCAKNDVPYTIIGHKGKQVRDNIHATDLARAFLAFYENPRCGVAYNMGGGRPNAVSVLEALDMAERATGKRLTWDYCETPRKGDHQWWITDTSAFRRDYPTWRIEIGINAIFEELAR